MVLYWGVPKDTPHFSLIVLISAKAVYFKH